MTVLYLDTETYNETDLKAAGTYRYAETAEIMLVTYAIDDGPVRCWDHSDGEASPDFASFVVRYPGLQVVAHNAMFDRNVLRLGDLRINIPIERWQCTMVQAMQHALPGSLDELGRVLGLPEDQRKLAEGKKLIQRFCKPAPKNHKARRYTRETHPDEWQRFKEYAKRDVAAMREIHKRLPTWNWKAEDIAMYHLDQRINDRGFAVDQELARAGAAAAIQEKEALTKRFQELTGLNPTQRAKVQAFLNDSYGLGVDSTAKHMMQPIADDESLPADLREIAHIMLSANKTSTAKYATIAKAVSSDGRFRGGLQFAGASRTRRWAGRKFQPQNLPSRGLPEAHQVETYIAALKAGVHTELFDDLMLYGAAALRGVVVV
jgi:DNA polymerase